jgi:hypothetical protein
MGDPPGRRGVTFGNLGVPAARQEAGWGAPVRRGMTRRAAMKNGRRLLLVIALGAIPLATTFTCDGFGRSLDVVRIGDNDCGIFDPFCDRYEVFDECVLHDCDVLIFED